MSRVGMLASACLCAALIAACASTTLYEVELMPAPDVYDADNLNPIPKESPAEEIPWGGVLYATNRRPADLDGRDRYYAKERGHRLLVGTAAIDFSDASIDWDLARDISLLKNRPGNYPLRVTGVDPYGPLRDGMSVFDRYAGPYADARFAALIDDKLASSQ